MFKAQSLPSDNKLLLSPLLQNLPLASVQSGAESCALWIRSLGFHVTMAICYDHINKSQPLSGLEKENTDMAMHLTCVLEKRSSLYCGVHRVGPLTEPVGAGTREIRMSSVSCKIMRWRFQ